MSSTPSPSPARIVYVVSPRVRSFGARPARRAGPGGAVLWLVGDLDAASSEDMLDGLIKVSDARRPGPVVLDLSRLTSLDAAGLRGLLVLRQRLAQRCQALVLRAVPEHALMVLRATGCLWAFALDDGASIFDDPA